MSNDNIEVVRKRLGAVTAYRYAVTQGYTGTEHEFAALMASYGTVAQEAAESAIAAAESASEAAASADAAAESARTLTIDSTLTQTGQAADAKVVGDEINSVKEDLRQNITFADATYIKHADGTLGLNYSQTKASEYVSVFPGQTFNLSGYIGNETISPTIGLAFYNIKKKYISGVQYDGNSISVSVPANAFYVRFTVYTSRINGYCVAVQSLDMSHDFTLRAPFEYTVNGMEIGRNNLLAMPRYSRIVDNLTFETGKYINDSGAVASVYYASLSDYIDVEHLEMVFVSLSNAIPISFFDENKNWILNYYDVTTLADSTPKKHELTIPANCKYIRISNITTILPNASVYIGYGYSYLSEEQNEHVDTITRKYVSTVNSGAESSVWFGQVTDYIAVNGIKAYYTSLSSVLSVCYYDAEKQYISGVNGEDGEAPFWRSVEAPENAVYIRISNDTRYNPFGISIRINLLEKLNAVANKTDIEDLQKQIDNADITRNVLPMYDNINCIGDSLTWSQVYYSAEGQRRAYKTYPQILASLCGAESHTYATPGDTAISWWQRSSAGAFTNHGLYIVFLGTNSGFTDTIATDCVGTDPDNFANTNTGQYGRILQTITNNGDKAILILPYAGGGGSAEALAVTRDVINQFGAKYNFPVINLDSTERTNAYYHYYPDKSGQNTVHFNDFGYAWVANEICQQINKLPVEVQWKIARQQ